MLHAVIMAGGTGTRFWPESRARRPKQLLRLAGNKTMIRATVDRLGELVPHDQVVIATSASLTEAIAAELPELPRHAILAEPCRRNTGPCIGLAALCVLRHDPDATMAVMPADHVIQPAESFRATIRLATALVEQRPERLVTLGIPPTYPAAIYGYIERGERLALTGVSADIQPLVYHVKHFHEKPSREVAAEYVASGKFYWNGGIFVWKARTILDMLRRYEPDMYRRLERIAAAADATDSAAVLQREFAAVESISIDYAVMERAGEVLVIEAPFAWDDVGSWQAIAQLRGADAQGNTIAAKHLGVDTTGTIVRGAQDHLIATVGLTDCIVVHTPNATLVANENDEESIRKIVELIEKQGWADYL